MILCIKFVMLGQSDWNTEENGINYFIIFFFIFFFIIKMIV